MAKFPYVTPWDTSQTEQDPFFPKALFNSCYLPFSSAPPHPESDTELCLEEAAEP